MTLTLNDVGDDYSTYTDTPTKLTFYDVRRGGRRFKFVRQNIYSIQFYIYFQSRKSIKLQSSIDYCVDYTVDGPGLQRIQILPIDVYVP